MHFNKLPNYPKFQMFNFYNQKTEFTQIQLYYLLTDFALNVLNVVQVTTVYESHYVKQKTKTLWVYINNIFFII